MTIMHQTHQPRGNFSPVFSAPPLGTFSPSFSPSSTSTNNFLLPVQEQDSLSLGITLLEKKISDFKSVSSSSSAEVEKAIEDLERGLSELKSYRYREAISTFQSILSNTSDPSLLSFAHLGCAVSCNHENEKSDALTHFTKVFELDVIKDQYVYNDLINLSLDSKDYKAAARYFENLFNIDESLRSTSKMENIAHKYINHLYEYMFEPRVSDASPFDEGYPIIRTYKEKYSGSGAQQQKSYEIQGKYELLYGLFKLKHATVSTTEPMIDDESSPLPSEIPPRALIQSGIDHFVSLAENWQSAGTSSLSVLELISSLYFHIPMQYGDTLETAKSFVLLIQLLQNKNPEKVTSTWLCRLANIIDKSTTYAGAVSSPSTNLLLANIYYLSLWKDSENTEAVEQLAGQFSRLGNSGELNMLYLKAAKNCEEYKNFLTGNLSEVSSITSFSALARSFPYDFGMTSANELIAQACTLLEIDTTSTSIKEIFSRWRLDSRTLRQFQHNGGHQALVKELEAHIPVELNEEHLTIGMSSIRSPSFGGTDLRVDTLHSESLLDHASVVGRGIDYLPELYPLLSDDQKEDVIEIYNDIIKIYLDWRKSETFRYHFFKNVEETNGQTPVLSLKWNTTEMFIRQVSQYLESKTDIQKKKWCYSVIYHIFSNFVTFNTLESLDEVPSWLSTLERRDEKLYFIIACSVASETGDMGVSELTPAIDDTNQVLQSHTLGLYYLQNLFLNSLSDHLEDFLNPEFKLFDEDKYLTFSLAKCRYRIGLNPFAVHYSPKGWPVSVSRDENLVGQKFLSMVGKLDGELPVNEHGQHWLTTNQTYQLCKHLSAYGLEILLDDDRSISFTIIPDQSYHKTVPEALPPDDVDPADEPGEPEVQDQPQDEGGAQDPLVDDRVPRRRAARRQSTVSSSTDLASKRTLIEEILEKIKPTDSDDFISLMSINGVKRLSLVHKKLSERQASIDAQYKTTINCALSEALKAPDDEDLAPPTYLHFDGVFELKPYQLKSLQRLLRLRSQGVPGGILALEMGLGKTALMAEYAMHMIKSQQAPSLVFCPKSVVKQTVKKLQEYFVIGQLNQLKYHLGHLHESLRDGRVTHTYKQRLGIVEQYLHHLTHVCTILHLDGLVPTIEELIRRVDSEYEEKQVLQHWSPEIRDSRTGRFKPENINEFLNGDAANNDNCHLLAIHPLLDIIELDGSVTPAIDRTNRIVVTNTEKVKSVITKSLGIEKVSWGTIFYDEAQTLHNTERQTFIAAKRLKEALQKNRINTSIILSTGTPYQNYDGDIFTLLNLLDPSKEYEADDEEFFHLDRMQNLFEKKRHETLKKLFKCLEYAKRHGGFGATRKSYIDFRDSFLHLIGLTESLKAIVNKLAIVTKRDDVRNQWGGNIPLVTTTEKELRFEGDAFAEQKTILTTLNNDFKRRFGSTMSNLESLRETIDSDELAPQRSGQSFFGFVAKVSRVMIHPEFHNRGKPARETLARNLSNPEIYTTEEVRGWVNHSIVLNSLFSDTFAEELAGGCVIFVNEIAPGLAIESCIKRLYPETKVSFLYGKTSQRDREAMVEQFEADNPDHEQRALIILKQSGATGTDLRKNGRTAHFCYFDFNPGNIEQAKSRIIRANSPKEQVNIVFHYIRNMFFSQCVQRHRTRKSCMETYFFEQQLPNPLELEEKASKLLRSLLLELSPSLMNKTRSADRVNLRNTLIGYIEDNRDLITELIDGINPLKSERMQEVTCEVTVDVEDGEVLPIHPMTPQHLHQTQPWSSPSMRSPMMTPRPSPSGRAPAPRFSPEFSPSPSHGASDPMLEMSPLPDDYVPMSPRYSEISRKRLREHSTTPQPSSTRSREIETLVSDTEQASTSNKRQRTSGQPGVGVTQNTQSISSLLAAADVMQNADIMKRFLIEGKLSEDMIKDSTIMLKLRNASHEVTEQNLWHIIPVLRNSMCFSSQGISAGSNLIQAIDFGNTFLKVDKRNVFNGVIPSLKSNPRLPLVARISYDAVGQIDQWLESWLSSMKPKSALPTTLDPIIRYLNEKRYDVVIYKTVFNTVTNSLSVTKRSLLQLENPTKIIYLIESAVGGTSHYDLLMRVPTNQ